MFDFPNSPIEGQIFAPPGGPRYKFQGQVWDVMGASPDVSLEDAFWATRADLVAALPITTIFNGKVYTAGGYDYVGSVGALAIPDLPGLLPLGDVYPEHWNDNATPLTTPMADAVQAAAIWAMGNRRTFKARGKYLLDHSIATPYPGFLNFDFVGARFVAGSGFALGVPVWDVTGAPAGYNPFWWEGGSFDGQTLPRAELGGPDFLNISTADSAEVVHLHVEEIYTGEDWRVAGGDSHIFCVSSRADIYIGHSQGAVDLGVYHSSSSTLSPARREFVKIRGNFKKCMRAAKATRGDQMLDIEINVSDCHEGWVGSAIDVEGTALASRTGHVKVVATRTRWPVNENRPFGIKYDVICTDNGVYLPESSPGAADEYVSAEGRCRFQGAVNCSGSISWVGINPEVASRGYGGGTISNFGALDMQDSVVDIDTVPCSGNFFWLHCYGGGRIILEREGATDNHYHVRSDISTCILLGTSSLVRVGHPTTFQDIYATAITGTAVTQSQRDETAGRLLKVGDFGLGAFANIGSAQDLNTLPPGLYGNASASSVPANVPVAGAHRWCGVVVKSSTSHGWQVFGRTNAGDALYFRRLDTDVWQPWKQITLI